MKVSFGFRPAALALLLLSLPSGAAPDRARDEAAIRELNQKMTDAILKMDDRANLALWAPDGVSLLPGSPPTSGMEALTRFMNDVSMKYADWKVVKQEDTCHDLRISGRLATEWCDTLQVVQPPGGKKPIESRGRMLLVLSKAADGSWKIQEEMWQSAG